MENIRNRFRTVIPLLAALLIAGCAAQRVVAPVSLVAAEANTSIPESQLLDIAMEVLMPVDEVSVAGDDALQSLRVAEGHYLSWHLARALRNSNHWGTIRLNPFALTNADLTIAGTVLQSDGETLRLRIQASDAAGQRWLDRDYYQVVDADAYVAKPGDTPPFPFQSLLNRIANDMVAFRDSRLAVGNLENIRKISALSFAAGFSPDIYGSYLKSDEDGYIVLERLPPNNDPVYAEITAIRDRNALFLDAIQSQYGVFVGRVDDPYRKFLARSQRITGNINDRIIDEQNAAQYGTSVHLDNGMEAQSVTPSRIDISNRRSNALNTGINALIYAAALARAGASFEMEVEPQTLEFSAHSVELSGNLEQQFQQWRQILMDIYTLDNGQ